MDAILAKTWPFPKVYRGFGCGRACVSLF